MNSQRYVVVEFRGGPRDGEREVWLYPLSTRELCVAARTGPAYVAATWPPPTEPDFGYFTHVYRTSDTDYEFDILTVTADKIGKAATEELVRTKARRPIIFTHHV